MFRTEPAREKKSHVEIAFDEQELIAREIGANGIAVFAALIRYQFGGYACVSLANLARYSGLSKRTLIRTLSLLEELGRIKRIRSIGEKNEFHLLPMPSEEKEDIFDGDEKESKPQQRGKFTQSDKSKSKSIAARAAATRANKQNNQENAQGGTAARVERRFRG